VVKFTRSKVFNLSDSFETQESLARPIPTLVTKANFLNQLHHSDFNIATLRTHSVTIIVAKKRFSAPQTVSLLSRVFGTDQRIKIVMKFRITMTHVQVAHLVVFLRKEKIMPGSSPLS